MEDQMQRQPEEEEEEEGEEEEEDALRIVEEAVTKARASFEHQCAG